MNEYSRAVTFQEDYAMQIVPPKNLSGLHEWIWVIFD